MTDTMTDIERDAARYRWIKAVPRLRIERMPDSHFWISTETGEKYSVTHTLSVFDTGFSGLPTLDDLVDQAMTMYPIPEGDLTAAESEELLLMCGHAPGPEPLSPAAQAVLDAVCDNTEPDCDTQHLIAAALRAVAEQVGPSDHLPPGFAYSAPAEMWHYEFKLKAQRQIFAIADELEGQDQLTKESD